MNFMSNLRMNSVSEKYYHRLNLPSILSRLNLPQLKAGLDVICPCAESLFFY